MPIYQYICTIHGPYEAYRPVEEYDRPSRCLTCGDIGHRLISLPALQFVNRERLRYGSGSPGRIVTREETGGMEVYIPSDGCMEQDEVDYIAQGAIEKEKARLKKGPQREVQAQLQAFTDLAYSTPKGQRAKAIRAAIAEGG